MSGLRRSLAVAIAIVLAVVSRFIPRTNAIWVFGGSRGLKYCDNAMYFFRHCNHRGDKRAVWLARSRAVVSEVRADGYEAHHILSPRGIWLGLRAKWHVFDVVPDDTGPTNCGALLLNLWHGVPLKDIRFLKRRVGKVSWWRQLVRRALAGRGRLDKSYFVHPNDIHVRHILDSFELLEANIIYANLPRNIVFAPGETTRGWCKRRDAPMVDRLRALTNEGARIIGYFPTWRGDASDQFLGTTDLTAIEQVNTFLKERNCYLLTKWHDCVYAAYRHAGSNSEAERLLDNLRAQSNFLVLDFDADLNSHLPSCDILVTDYSSVFFDFLFTDRPILFLAYDLESYESKWGFFFDYRSFVPGPVIRDIKGLMTSLSEQLDAPGARQDAFLDRRRTHRATFFQYPGGPALISARMDAIAGGLEDTSQQAQSQGDA